MKKQLLLFLFAIVASVGTMFADGTKIGDLYYNLNKTDKTAEVYFSGEISVNDNSLADWEALPQEFVASATCPADASMLGLKSVKVFADAKYIYILVEPNMDEIDDTEWVPFHVFIDTDNSDATGGYGDEFTDANTDIMLETALIAAGAPNNYNPSVWKWWGEVGGRGWIWSDPAITGYESNFWGAMIGEGQQPVGASEGVGGKYEIQILRELIPECTWADEFGIGFNIQQNWTSVGILPCVSPTDENPNGMAAKLKVKIANAAATGVISGNVVIPASVSYEGTSYSVTGIADYAFSGCSSLTSVTIPNSVTSIGYGAFYRCSSLTSVTLGTSVKVIEEYAFYDCTAIETITCYSMRPPTVNNGAFENLDYSTIVYVPADYLNTYKMHDAWGLYDVRPIGASKTETTEVKVEPTATTADVTWPAVENAATYELVIKDKNGNIVCTLIFNANGQLTQIAFGASARDNTAQAAGFAFTVTGLEEGTSYDLTITAKDGNGTTLDEKTIAFTTSGETGVDALPTNELHSSKVLRNGEVLILRDGKMYNLQGVEVK